MILLPAIDIRDGRAVRLRQGDFGRETVYSDDPVEAARSWVEAGARMLHVVDLDGARDGAPASLGHLRRIASRVEVPVQYGGGLRDERAIADALAAGAERLVIGTAALSDERFLAGAVERFGDRVAVALDARGGELAVEGWTAGTGERAEAVAGRLLDTGVGRVVYTNVDRDGMLDGPDLDGLRRMARLLDGRARLVYSGGVGTLDHLRSIAGLGAGALDAVICGKALYEGRFTVAQAAAVVAGGDA